MSFCKICYVETFDYKRGLSGNPFLIPQHCRGIPQRRKKWNQLGLLAGTMRKKENVILATSAFLLLSGFLFCNSEVKLLWNLDTPRFKTLKKSTLSRTSLSAGNVGKSRGGKKEDGEPIRTLQKRKKENVILATSAFVFIRFFSLL